ncbi:nucleotidyltransferase family protein [Shimia sp.]|uniref:nucleotidyltransferase family protein n=1 Tax=Shimia sp. TaxID=1954381 RepID=UPI0032996A06
MLCILLLAAGRSSRMRGADKLLNTVQNAPLIVTMTKRALATGLPVSVCLPDLTGPRANALHSLAVSMVPVADADLGMAHSIRAGTSTLPDDCSAIMILPADMPEITARDLRQMHTAHKAAPTAIIRGASADGRPGHPVVFPKSTFNKLAGISGDTGAKPVISGFDGEIRLVPLPAQHALTDLDTPEDWQNWHARS